VYSLLCASVPRGGGLRAGCPDSPRPRTGRTTAPTARSRMHRPIARGPALRRARRPGARACTSATAATAVSRSSGSGSRTLPRRRRTWPRRWAALSDAALTGSKKKYPCRAPDRRVKATAVIVPGASSAGGTRRPGRQHRGTNAAGRAVMLPRGCQVTRLALRARRSRDPQRCSTLWTLADRSGASSRQLCCSAGAGMRSATRSEMRSCVATRRETVRLLRQRRPVSASARRCTWEKWHNNAPASKRMRPGG